MNTLAGSAATSGIPTPVETAVHSSHIPLNFQLAPRFLPAETSCEPTKVAISLSTQIVIPDYARYYHNTPLQSFHPSYVALNDGSLIAAPFVDDMLQANLSLLILSAMSLLFIRNIIVTGDYLFRRSRIIKVRFLFHLLFGSQLLGLVGIVPSLLSYFSQAINCSAAMIVATLSGLLGLALIVTGILGFKAYKCLNNSYVIPITLVLFQIALVVAAVFEVREMIGARRLSGSCIRLTPLFFTTASSALLFAETLFICLCFGTAIWKSRGSPSTRCRISLRLSMDNPVEDELDSAASARPLTRSRGWWDYVPENENNTSPAMDQNQNQPGMVDTIRSGLSGLFFRGPSHPPAQVYTGPGRKPSVTSDAPLSQPPRRQPSVQFNETKEIGEETIQSPERQRSSPVPSSSSRLSRFSRLLPRMQLFQKVLKNELFYTTFISCTCLLSVVFSLIGLNLRNGLTIIGWQSLNWALISVVVIHCFERSLRRHENDLLVFQATKHTVPRIQQPYPRHYGNNSVSVTSLSHRRFPRFGRRQDIETENPFSDTQRLTQSWHSSGRSRSVSPSRTDEDRIESFSSSPLDAPSSAYMANAVTHKSVDGTYIPGLSQRWTSSSPTPLSPGASSRLSQ